MLDYSQCDSNTLCRHMSDTLPEGAMSARYRGVYYEEADTETVFREGLCSFVCCCNQERSTAEGFELCEDYDPKTGVTTFYVMREDGVQMLSIDVFFLQRDSGVGLHAACS